MTRQRAAVLEQLSQQSDFRSAQQVHDDLHSAGQKVSLATVYRNLQTLVDNQQVDTVRGLDGEILYRLCTEEAHHHHLICRSCGRVEEIRPELLESWVNNLAAEHGFHQPTHFLEIFGLCEQCYSKVPSS
ncbi:Fur family transcriptional regulator [Scrofimicrobium sp. R131]|uniref:Fur family transcriptional regulator n=1 Tax=Scrofimicrobium appendicitidis TaxID=3079930 RepID=A0AAU7V9K9_9ACTO